MSMKRRTVLKGLAATGVAAVYAPAVLRAQGAPFKIGLLTVKTGPLAQGGIQMEQGIATFLKEKGNTLARPQDRLHLGRHRRQSGRRQDQGAGADRARQGQRHPRAARRLRAARHHRLRPRQPDAADQPRGRRRRHPAQGQSVRHPPVGDLGAVLSRHGRLRRQGAQVQARRDDLRGLRLRLRADVRLPARVRGQRRQGGEEAVAAAGDAGLHAVHRADRQRRLRVQRLRRIESGEVHARLCGSRRQGPGSRCSPAGPPWTTRCCAASATRRSA